MLVKIVSFSHTYPRRGRLFSVIKILSICKLFVGWNVTKIFWKWLNLEEKKNVNQHTLKFSLLIYPYSDLLYTIVPFLVPSGPGIRGLSGFERLGHFSRSRPLSKFWSVPFTPQQSSRDLHCWYYRHVYVSLLI